MAEDEDEESAGEEEAIVNEGMGVGDGVKEEVEKRVKIIVKAVKW